ncbi:lysosomal acid phosphatase-like isoform X2 [Pristis pectinata]|uniref:lysosomal acid phosphatase-like isoform X2 n=1 Tax=Pristis pectinata TaxID=685728 RepID=UPI00223CE403|nr:lysosomal acid phosphatase-like isoform X2 [Pristis pectinata]
MLTHPRLYLRTPGLIFGRCRGPGSGCRMAGAEAALLPYPVLLCALLAVGLQTPVAGRTLRFVNLVYRHGDRSPVRRYPKDPITEKDWPQGFGQLTQVGMRQHYALGQYLRNRYRGFLSSSYDGREIYVRSTDFDRTLMSAESNLAGLYPPQGRQIFRPGLRWQPIPVHTMPVEQDKLLLYPMKDCPRYTKLIAETEDTDEYIKMVKLNKNFLAMLSNATGVPRDQMSFKYVWLIYDTLLCEQLHNKTVPSWVTSSVMERMRTLKEFSIDVDYRLYKREEKSRLQGGVLLKQILQNIEQSRNTSPTPSPKLMVYSAHDTTIVALQMALSVYSLAPTYAACHIVELYLEDDGSFTVEMYYRNESSSAPYPLTLPACTQRCPLDKFIQIAKRVIPDDWDEECGRTGNHVPIELILGLAVGCCLLLVLILLAALLCHHGKDRHLNYWKVAEDNENSQRRALI